MTGSRFVLVLALSACSTGTTQDAPEDTLVDADGDGWLAEWGDCDDADAGVNGGVVEVDGNGVDDDCDGQVDEPETGGGPYADAVRPQLVAGADFAYADAFEYPIGDGASRTHCNDGDGWYVAQEFKEASACGLYSRYGEEHLGEDWNGEGGGNSDLGEPVGTLANGEVVYAGYAGRGWGDVVIVRHVAAPGSYFERPDGGTLTEVFALFAHLDDVWVVDGDAVTAGDLIGTIGTARGRWVAHLHLEVIADPSTSFPGPGYFSDSLGRVDPTEFLDLNRTVSGGSSLFELCNGLDDDEDGLVDNDPSCWQAVYRFAHESGARCWGLDDSSPPAACADYAFDREAWIAPSTGVPGAVALRQCSLATDHILVPADHSDRAELEGAGYDCDLELAYAYMPGEAPQDVTWVDSCPVYRFAWDIDGSGTHLFTPGPDGTAGMTCEGHRFDVHTTQTCFVSRPAECPL